MSVTFQELSQVLGDRAQNESDTDPVLKGLSGSGAGAEWERNRCKAAWGERLSQSHALTALLPLA